MKPRGPRLLVLPLLLILLLLVPAVRPATADETTYRNLMDRALEALGDAERRHQDGDARAAESARRALVLLAQADQQRTRDPEVALRGVQASVFATDRRGAALWLERYEARSAYGERDPLLHYLRALIALELDDRPDRALAALEARRGLPGATVKDRPSEILTYAALMAQGRRNVRSGRWDPAIDAFKRAVQVALGLGARRKQLAARANVGIALQQAGRQEECAQVFGGLARDDPDGAIWHWYLALSLANQSKFAEAVAPYRRVLQLLDEKKVAPGYLRELQQADLKLGNTYRQLARKEKDPAKRRTLLTQAKASLEAYLVRAPRSVPGHYWLGVLLFEEFGRPYEALAEFEKAHALDPICDASLGYLVRIASRHGPAPGGDPDRRAEVEAAWKKRLAAWKQDLEENAAAREARRAKRRRASGNGNDGCY